MTLKSEMKMRKDGPPANWTTKEIADVVERGVAHEAINKATGGAATEFVDAATGRFVVVDNSTKQVIQVSGSGHLPTTC